MDIDFTRNFTLERAGFTFMVPERLHGFSSDAPVLRPRRM